MLKTLFRLCGFVLLIVVLAFLRGTAHAAVDTVSAPPPDGTQTVNGLRLTQIAPTAAERVEAGRAVALRYALADANGAPIRDAVLTLDATRDYSGQVHTDANGPHDKDVTATLAPDAGQYVASATFPDNGYWTFRLTVAPATSDPTTFAWRQSIAFGSVDNAGVGIEWLLVPTILTLALTIIITARRIERRAHAPATV